MRGTENLRSLVAKSKKFAMIEEMEPVLDALWDINKEIQQYAYPEPRLFFWEGFEYGKDDWRKLLELTKKHSYQGFSKSMPQTTLDGILNKAHRITKKE